jgi:hypothetical protein
MKNFSPQALIGAAVIVAVAIFSLAILLSANGRYFFKNIKSDISVTGSASKDFASDLVVWNGEFKKTHMDIKKAYALMKEDKEVIREFLISKGIAANEFSFMSINIEKKYKTKNHFNSEGDLVDRESIFDGFELKQQVGVNSSNVNLISRVSNEVTELIEKDVYIRSFSPKYYYTRLGELKIEMIQLAAEDGLMRARTAVEGGDGGLGDLLETSIGVFQILGTNSNDSFSWGGTLNTDHMYKTAYVNVKQKYEIE